MIKKTISMIKRTILNQEYLDCLGRQTNKTKEKVRNVNSQCHSVLDFYIDVSIYSVCDLRPLSPYIYISHQTHIHTHMKFTHVTVGFAIQFEIMNCNTVRDNDTVRHLSVRHFIMSEGFWDILKVDRLVLKVTVFHDVGSKQVTE
jgi:hypothetical protein